MRSFIVTCLTMCITFQLGCALTTKSTAQNMPKSSVKDGDKFLAAKKLEDQGKLENAREMYEELLVKQPDEPVYLHRLAVVCTLLQRYGEANSLYERARLKDPKNVSLLSDMGYAAYLRGDYVLAEQILREAVHLKPSYKRASSNLALVVGRQGNFDESLELLRSVGSEANALARLAYIHTLRGEYDLAELRYRAALEIDPDFKEAKLALAELPRRKSAKSVSVAEAKSAPDDIIDFGEAPSKPAQVQQVSAVNDDFEQSVKTATFAGEFSESAQPERLVEDDEPSWMKQPAASGSTTVNRLTFGPSQAPQKKAVDTDFDDAEETFAKPAKSDDSE